MQQGVFLVWSSTDGLGCLFGLAFPLVWAPKSYCKELIDVPLCARVFSAGELGERQAQVPSKQRAVGFAWLPLRNPRQERQENKPIRQRWGSWHPSPLCWLGCETDPEEELGF